MIKIYAILVKRGSKKIEEIPPHLQAEVQALVDEMD